MRRELHASAKFYYGKTDQKFFRGAWPDQNCAENRRKRNKIV